MPDLSHSRYVSSERSLSLLITDVSPRQHRALVEAAESALAAMPTEPRPTPTEGEVWSDANGVHHEVGPIKWGGALCLRLSDNVGTGYLVSHISENWERVE